MRNDKLATPNKRITDDANMTLNPAQQDAVETLAGPLLVLAGAGTGKTRVVTHRIARLIRHRTRPERILAVTFTNKAAGEMHERAGQLLGKRQNSKQRPEISTFHSLCVRILRRQIHRLGYPRQFVIFDRGDQEGAARQVLRELRVAGRKTAPWRFAVLHRPLESVVLAAGRSDFGCGNRQGASRRLRLSPLSRRVENGRRGRFRRSAAC